MPVPESPIVDLLGALQKAVDRAREDRQASTVLPDHYRDDGAWCRFSGCSSRSGSCPAGCEGALHHYSNDGHPECADEDAKDH